MWKGHHVHSILETREKKENLDDHILGLEMEYSPSKSE